jgi:hypothetical protein
MEQNPVGYDKSIRTLVELERYTITLRHNVSCGDIKNTLNDVPDHAILTIISSEEFGDTELYFDIERLY